MSTRLSQKDLQSLVKSGKPWARKALDDLRRRESRGGRQGSSGAQGKQATLCDLLSKQLQMVGAPVYRWEGHPDGEYRFHPTRRWRLDFYFPGFDMAIEVDGGVESHRRHTQTNSDGSSTYKQSRHLTPQGYEGDCIKLYHAGLAGIFVIRVTSNMVKNNQAIAMAMSALQSKGWSHNGSEVSEAFLATPLS